MIRSREEILEEVEKLPELPGVYIFKNSSSKVIYVGKAKSIRKRVRSHFLKPVDAKHEAMISQVFEIEHIVTGNELEALILEYNLIKKYRPKFNVLYRDDKSYPYIAVTLSDEWPRVILTRNLNIEGARYFGPYPKASRAREVLNSLLKLFPLRTCKGKQPGKSGKAPCLMFFVKKCSGPCINAVSKEKYMGYVSQVMDFLSGKSDWLIEDLERKMKDASDRLEFEKAAAFREKLLAARYVLSQQRVALERKIDADVFGFYSIAEANNSYVRILKVRSGKIIGAYGYSFESAEYEPVIREALLLFYSSNGDFPEEVILPQRLRESVKKEIEDFLKNASGRKILVKDSVKGERADLIEMANENAATNYFWFRFQSKASIERTHQALQELHERLKLKRLPLVIECYDMSGFKYENPVGTMVAFVDGQPDRSSYRKFRIKGAKTSDYHKMYEVIFRRMEKINKSTDRGFSRMPDLVIVDGGKSQLKAAIEAIHNSLGPDALEKLDVIAIAKPDGKIYREGNRDPVKLPKNSEAYKLLTRIRDEAHRTAVGYFRKLEEKRLKLSILDGIKGIGPQRKKKLMEYFGDIEKIRKASLFELQKVVPREVALRIKEVLNTD